MTKKYRSDEPVRKYKTSETRLANMRDSDEETALRMVSKSFFDTIDTSKIPHGMEYGVIRERLLGELDESNYARSSQAGWRAVPADRHPELAGTDVRGNKTFKNGFVEHRGGLLCERPIRIGDQIRRAQEEQTSSEIRTIDEKNLKGNSQMPFQVITHKMARGGRNDLSFSD